MDIGLIHFAGNPMLAVMHLQDINGSVLRNFGSSIASQMSAKDGSS